MTYTETLAIAKQNNIEAGKLNIANTIALYDYTPQSIGVESFEILCKLIEAADEGDDRAPIDDMVYAMVRLIEEGSLNLNPDDLPAEGTQQWEAVVCTICSNAHYIQN